LRGYEWPGNVRELKNLVQRLLILGSRENVELDEIEIVIGKQSKQMPVQEFNTNFELPLREAREQFEKPIYNTNSNGQTAVSAKSPKP
jgi:Response regulator containing CheY-like receiver, AAA-type ATPase, and DNA-binding domains